MSTVNGFQVGAETLKYNYESLENYNTPNFSTSSSTNYAVGDYVMYNGKLYKCITATTGGTWVSGSWTEAVLSDDVSNLTSQLNVIPTFHNQLYVPNPVESADYDIIFVPNESNEVYLDEFETLDTAHFNFSTTGTATVTASDGYLVFTTVENESGAAVVTYNYNVDITKNTRFSMLFNYVTANNSSFRLFDIGSGNLYVLFNKTNKLRIVCKDPNNNTKYIASDGSVSDSATNFDIAVNTEYVFECIIAENKVKLKIYNPADDSVVFNTTTQLSALISLNENGIRWGKTASTASTAVNYKVGWFQHDEIED